MPWKNPTENGLVLELLAGLVRAGLLVEAVMASSRTYGDVLRQQLVTGGVPVYRVSGKRTHDAAEVYDGVPSLHDAAGAAIIAKLHLDGASRRWEPLQCAPELGCGRIRRSCITFQLSQFGLRKHANPTEQRRLRD